MKQRANYQEGDWFAVPLPSGGFSIGAVARMDGKGIVLGYFFGPAHDKLPDLKDLQSLRPPSAEMVTLFGDLALIEGRWPILGSNGAWNRESWPVPTFVRKEGITNATFLVHYSDALVEREAILTDRTLATGLPQDGVWGYEGLEVVLGRRFRRV